MVAIKAIRASNATFKSKSTPGMVAVFAGATSGIGLGTLKAFIKNANAPKAYIIGRSESAAAALLEDLRRSNASATLIFLQGELSLIKEVDRLCDEINSKEKKVDFIFLSASYLSWGGRNGLSSSLAFISFHYVLIDIVQNHLKESTFLNPSVTTPVSALLIICSLF